MLFIDSPTPPPSERRQTHVKLRAKWLPALMPQQQRNVTKIKQAVPEIHEEGDEIRRGSLNR